MERKNESESLEKKTPVPKKKKEMKRNGRTAPAKAPGRLGAPPLSSLAFPVDWPALRCLDSLAFRAATGERGN
ncbi:hypothetical protein TGRUB_362710 [Toxoplasma gondii RUB]|uniref:Uncharacterized protein n=1 Tax=Toxoplasma gondii RUB TaxID=935652 RepID=A0A086LZP7_TOXGO|nr:hypothetical protein TGRUB_362710 [Toxoplasma gondii RUB]